MVLWDKLRDGIDKAGKAAQDVFDEGKLRIEAYRAREAADKAAEKLGYAFFRAAETGTGLDAESHTGLIEALRVADTNARSKENELARARAQARKPEEATAAAETPTETPGETPVDQAPRDTA